MLSKPRIKTNIGSSKKMLSKPKMNIELSKEMLQELNGYWIRVEEMLRTKENVYREKGGKRKKEPFEKKPEALNGR
jgi:hypothetical protein